MHTTLECRSWLRWCQMSKPNQGGEVGWGGSCVRKLVALVSDSAVASSLQPYKVHKSE